MATQTLPTSLTDWYQSANNTTVPQTTGLLSQPGSTQVSPTTYNPTTLKDPAQWNITPEQTVSGQIDKTIAQDSPLMQQARTQGLQQANSRGLLNSSMAVGAAQDSVIKNALPIAQFDADINAKAAGYNADTQNTFTKTNAAMENEAKTFGAQSINRSNEFNATNEYNKQQSRFEANVKASLAQIENEAQFDRQSQAIYGTLGQEFMKAISAINADTNMNQQSKDYSIQQMFKAYKAQVSMLSAVGSIPDVSRLLIQV